jgi:Spy/CpxP family protein refolding chaperone
VPVRLDLAHVGTPEQQLGMSLGTVMALAECAQRCSAKVLS